MKIPFSQYNETRLPASLQRVVNMYPHTNGSGMRQFPGLTLFSSVVTLEDYTDHDEGTTLSGETKGLVFGDSGTKMYVADRQAGIGLAVDVVIHEFALSTPYDPSTETLTSTTIVNTGSVADDDCAIIGFNSAGTKMLAIFYDDSLTRTSLHGWDITAWDSSTAASTPDDVGTMVSAFRNVERSALKPDGLSVFAAFGNTLYEYTLSTAFDATSTITEQANTLNMSGVTGSVRSLDFTSNGAQMYAPSSQGATRPVNLFEFSTAWDLSTGQFLGALEDANVTSNARGTAVVNNDSRVVFVVPDNANEFIWFDIVSGVPRGAINMGGVFYAVVGTVLYSVSSTGVTTEIGDIAGTARVVMDTDGVQLGIATGASGNTIYRYTVAGGLAAVVDGDVDDNANSLAYLDLRFYFAQGGQFKASAVDDLSSIDPLDFATAESFADDILRTFALNGYLYLFGDKRSTEVWYTATGRPPVNRQDVIERGIIGTHAVDSFDDNIYFVDQTRRPNVLVGLQYQPIYTPGIARAWDSYSTVSDCIVTAYSFEQQVFVDFIFPTADVTWTYHVPSGRWCEREDTSNNRFRSIEYVNVYGKTLAIDHLNAKIFELTETNYQDDGSSITRTLQTERITSERWGRPGKELSLDEVKFTLESTGSGSVSVAVSRDGGAVETGQSISVTSGVNDYILCAQGPVREGVLQISTTDNIGLDVIECNVEAEVYLD